MVQSQSVQGGDVPPQSPQIVDHLRGQRHGLGQGDSGGDFALSWIGGCRRRREGGGQRRTADAGWREHRGIAGVVGGARAGVTGLGVRGAGAPSVRRPGRRR
ncbi:hypothetical protein ACFFX0_07805 [Citricoccus parietis]|uniref:Uncharacterized protein n=1 Tax=Citricoccus parietis TaxID=592307 RepID=A0ABV5FWQ5_9MICC